MRTSQSYIFQRKALDNRSAVYYTANYQPDLNGLYDHLFGSRSSGSVCFKQISSIKKRYKLSKRKGDVMAHHRMALCDGNIHYGRKLADYLEHQKGFPYDVIHFSEWEQFSAYRTQEQGTEPITHVILSEDMVPYLKNDTNVEKIFVLTTDREECMKEKAAPGEQDGMGSEQGQSQIVPIYRYQPAGHIMRQLLGNLETEQSRTGFERKQAPGVEIIGVYTPVKRCMQTSFCVLLGQMLTRRKRTLYLNLEGISGFRVLLGKELKPDITDFLYYAERDSGRFMARLEQMIDRIGELEYLPPAATFMDLMSVGEEQWMSLLHELEKDGRFGYVILDLTEQVQGLFSILERCDLIYMIESDDGVAKAKIREYEQMLWISEHENILRKIRKKKLPVIRRTELDFFQLRYTELADEIQKLIKEDFGDGTYVENIKESDPGAGSSANGYEQHENG